MNMNSRLLAVLGRCLFILSIVTSGNAQSVTLEPRLGGLAYYHPDLDITWTANANINGDMDWDTATTWAAGLTIGGVGGWRLPTMDRNNDGIVETCPGICEDSEFGWLYWLDGITTDNPDPFNNVQFHYWSSTQEDADTAWVFFFFNGVSGLADKNISSNVWAWAVHDGDVIPIPGAVWLFGSGLLGLVGIARRKQSA